MLPCGGTVNTLTSTRVCTKPGGISVGTGPTDQVESRVGAQPACVRLHGFQQDFVRSHDRAALWERDRVVAVHLDDAVSVTRVALSLNVEIVRLETSDGRSPS